MLKRSQNSCCRWGFSREVCTMMNYSWFLYWPHFKWIATACQSIHLSVSALNFKNGYWVKTPFSKSDCSNFFFILLLVGSQFVSLPSVFLSSTYFHTLVNNLIIQLLSGLIFEKLWLGNCRKQQPSLAI